MLISEFFLSLGLTVATWFVGLFPTDWEVPAEFVSLDEQISGFLAQFGGLGAWAPWPLLIGCVLVSVGAWSIGLIVKAIRAAAAHIPMVGGAG